LFFNTASNTYTGPTTVNAGTLCIDNRNVLPQTTALSLPAAANSLILSNATVATVATLTIGGRPMYKGTWGATGLQHPSITGPGSLLVTNGPTPQVYLSGGNVIYGNGKVVIPQ
jgi:autotransporter-associated beta strand protein